MSVFVSDDILCILQSSSQKLETEKNKAETEVENKKLELSQKLEELAEIQRNFEQSQSELVKVFFSPCWHLTNEFLETSDLRISDKSWNIIYLISLIICWKYWVHMVANWLTLILKYLRNQTKTLKYLIICCYGFLPEGYCRARIWIKNRKLGKAAYRNETKLPSKQNMKRNNK